MPGVLPHTALGNARQSASIKYKVVESIPGQQNNMSGSSHCRHHRARRFPGSQREQTAGTVRRASLRGPSSCTT